MYKINSVYIQMTKLFPYPTLIATLIFIMFCSCSKQITNSTIPNVPPIVPAQSGTPVPEDPAAVIYLSAGYSNDLFAVDATNGAILWSTKVKGTYNTSAAYTQGTILVKGFDDFQPADISAFGTDGTLKWTYHVPGVFEYNQTALIASDGVAYTQDRDQIIAINVSDGSVKWTCDKPVSEDGGSFLNNNTLYANIIEPGSLFSIDKQTGKLNWSVGTYIPSTPFISGDSIFQADAKYVFIYDAHTGEIKNTITSFPTNGPINIKYGRVFSFDSQTTDSATFSINYPFNYSPSPLIPPGYINGSIYPIVADSMVILPYGIFNAFTGDVICTPSPFFYPGTTRPESYGATYVNHILYYSSCMRSEYDATLAVHYYSDIFAYDVRNKSQLWHVAIENTDLYNVEPCIVTKSGAIYRGVFTYH